MFRWRRYKHILIKMGSVSHNKHTSTSKPQKINETSSSQRKIDEDYNNKNHRGISDREISIIKTIGFAIAPQLAPFIVAAYHIYKNRETIKKVTQDISEGNYSSAIQTVVTSLTINSVKYLINEVGEEIIDKVIDASADKLDEEKVFENASEYVFGDKIHKELIRKYYKNSLERIIEEAT